jgi:hypothetical protein
LIEDGGISQNESVLALQQQFLVGALIESIKVNPLLSIFNSNNKWAELKVLMSKEVRRLNQPLILHKGGIGQY